MPARRGIHLKSITFNDGTKLPFDDGSIVVITGPNNCGKSQTLREITFHPVINRSTVVTAAIEGHFEGNLFEIVQDLIRHPALKPNKVFFENTLTNSQGNPSIFLTNMAANPHLYKPVLNGFMLHLSTLTRLLSLSSVQDGTEAVSVQPFNTTSLHRIYEDEKMAEKVYNYTKTVFGKGIMMNHASYQDQELYFLDREASVAPAAKGTIEYARWFESQQTLRQQGDGIHSFAAILISIMQQMTPLVLLDEPEAFLHPPQIREIARLISKEISSDTQLVVSTHSDDFIRGMIDFAAQRTSVVRMTRKRVADGREINTIRKLDAKDISQLWNDPLLKTSDVLTSLFHQVAVIVEGDSDARFLRAMVDCITAESERGLDLRFYHCGGKDKVAKIASALNAIGVSTLCVVDIDILDNKTKFLELVSAFGGDADSFDRDVQDIIRFVEQKRPSFTGIEVKAEIEKQLASIDLSKPLHAEMSKKLSDIAKRTTAWPQVKQAGETFFSGGEPYNIFQRVCSRADAAGIIINRQGELENFCRAVSAKRKGEWLADVLVRDLKNDPALREAREFAEALVSKCRQVAA